VILLDTNVVSELIKSSPNTDVANFFARQILSDLFVPSPVVAEIRYGLGRLPPGHRRDDLTHAFREFLAVGFRSRILPFDYDCAEGYAAARVRRERA
jgi:predicted nucleic acid-binding protein